MKAVPDLGWVAVPGGVFAMGGVAGDRFVNPTELPVREHEVGGFEMMACPVSEVQWAAVTGAGAESDLPVVRVSWLEAVEFAAQLGGGCRLPSEVEWEHACRAGSRTPFSGRSMISPAEANFLYDEGGTPVGVGARTPVGSYPPNAFGLHDLQGNVCEWTADRWRESHDGPELAGRVIRGGAWDHLPRLLRCSWRDGAPESTRRDNLGFRLVRS